MIQPWQVTPSPGDGRRSVGILTARTEGLPPFDNRGFYRRLIRAGRPLGLSVFVFTPHDLPEGDDVITGYRYNEAARRWERTDCPLPALVYDRCFSLSREASVLYRAALRRLQAEPGVRLLGSPLPGKWDVHRHLERDGRFTALLPRTEPLTLRALAAWLQEHDEVLLKPQAGSQGRGVLHVRRGALRAGAQPTRRGEAAEAAYSVRGRDARGREVSRGFADAAALGQWLRGFVRGRRYLLQQYLQLQTEAGAAFDVRALVQKDGSGRWQLTGTAVRQAPAGSVTANLHGGGTAAPAEAFLAGRFGAQRGAALHRELCRLAAELPEALEAGYGRFAELGIDFGVDRDGRLWLLEVNSKPGRSVFTLLGDARAAEAALLRPLQYAASLLPAAGRGAGHGMQRAAAPPAPAALAALHADALPPADAHASLLADAPPPAAAHASLLADASPPAAAHASLLADASPPANRPGFRPSAARAPRPLPWIADRVTKPAAAVSSADD
ncbi:YheC/YheD family protein [Paenibacillus mucilaginosus]|uniref:YheC/YheD family endospore coat-associated protein n=1 Tax=Paenibacillus mucilaginosus TaxID=61624 RepID=UPI001EF003BF|nr:YheC/YheD family protein [Paenibacillus mucilaginosus]MCG7217871.1 YheC/YheD family protein [Paenibacillus mucilaginosus]WDM29101.1 YheC/YheD family protein [Paenibacillus mucilaginosus]